MTVVLPKEYHARQELEQRRILCIDQEEALREDIRALRVGILNIMPMADTYEFSLLFPLGRSVIQIEPVWLRLKTHAYSSTSSSHLDNLYVTFEEATKTKGLDGLILTGAPVEEMPFHKVTYWAEIKSILAYARTNMPSTLGICWGGLALAKFLGIDKVAFDKKLFGVFETVNIDRTHSVSGEMDDVFWCPHSRFSGIPDEVLERERDLGHVNLLAHSKEAGYVIFESSDGKFLMHLGHHEYEAKRLVDEYRRDMAKGRADVEAPVNLDVDHPVNRWRGQSLEFFAQWIRYLHEMAQGRP